MPKNIEIERKFLLKNEKWRGLVTKTTMIVQGSIVDPVTKSQARIRSSDGIYVLTIKGPSAPEALERPEVECEIYLTPKKFEAALKMCSRHIEKIRYTVPHHEEEGLEWEIDEFLGANEGLVVAEIELDRENQPFSCPDWIGEDVTDDPKYLNVNLATNPSSTW